MRLIGILFCLIVMFNVSAIAQPKLQIIGAVDFNFGIAPQSATVVNYFWFKSVGKDTLRIDRIKTGCDCATMPLPKSVLAPGDSVQVGFFWDTQLKLGVSGRYPYIYVDNVADPYRLALTMNVIARADSAVPLSLKPYKIELSKMAGTSIDSVGFVLTNRKSDGLTFKVVSVVPSDFSYQIPDSLPPNGTAKGYVKVAPSMTDREFKSSITIEWTSSANETGRITLPIRRKLFG
jgi:hypothetical protein